MVVLIQPLEWQPPSDQPFLWEVPPADSTLLDSTSYEDTDD